MDSTSQRKVSIALLQCLHSQMHRDQRGCASSIYRHRGPFHSQYKHYPSADVVQRGAGSGVQTRHWVCRRYGIEYPLAVFHIADAGVNAGPAPSEPVGTYDCILESLPTDLEHEALLRVEKFGLSGRYPEKRRIEQIDVVDVSAKATCVIWDILVRKNLPNTSYAGAGNAFDDRVASFG